MIRPSLKQDRRAEESPAHIVTSEVELELEQVQLTPAANANPARLFAVPLLPILVEDNDGDIVVPRRKVQKRMKFAEQQTDIHKISLSELGNTQSDFAARGTDAVFILEARIRTAWDTAGTQLWRAAFLLAEYMYSAPVCFVMPLQLVDSRSGF
ncbi:unnamed protein product [Phytophthora lilii]|uniref:Unnamed protein product n=1 Tax=Phytophthora lilii TaxID=2077276 RepID=A0A9W6XAW3_9STRA|nr:unnamed protein product [Phytophthora lilii]